MSDCPLRAQIRQLYLINRKPLLPPMIRKGQLRRERMAARKGKKEKTGLPLYKGGSEPPVHTLSIKRLERLKKRREKAEKAGE